MFKFIHAADIHLDSPLHGLSNYEGAPVESIRNATRQAFEALVDLAIENEVAFVLLAGDLYDGDWKDYNTGLFFNRQMARLDKSGIPVFVVAGNHDAQSSITRSLHPPNNVTIFPAKKSSTVTMDDFGVAIHGQSYATPAVKDDLASHYPEPISGKLNIGLLHTSLDGRPGHEPYAPCNPDTLKTKGYDYWALGHVHTREVVAKEPYIVYPGCIQGRNIRETGRKGCTLVSFDDGGITGIEHQDLDVLRWDICPVSLSDIAADSAAQEKIQNALREQISTTDDQLVAVRIILEGASALNSNIQANPERWENQIRAIATEVDDEKLWVEKIKIQTTSKQDREAILAHDSPLAGMLNSIIDFPSQIEQDTRLARDIATLKEKLPYDLFQKFSDIDLNDPEVISAVVENAKEHLIALLLAEEVDP